MDAEDRIRSFDQPISLRQQLGAKRFGLPTASRDEMVKTIVTAQP